MIRLYYTKTRANNTDLAHFVVSTLVSNLSHDKDLVLVPSTAFLESCNSCAMFRADQKSSYRHYLDFQSKYAIVESEFMDLEKLIKTKYRNIVLINFDQMDSSILRCLINKSKKTEIIGISSEHSEYFRSIQSEIDKYQRKGFSKDQILVMIVLKYNCPSEMVSTCLNNIKFKTTSIKVDEIDNVEDTIQYLKV